jgi:hypothetical protein
VKIEKIVKGFGLIVIDKAQMIKTMSYGGCVREERIQCNKERMRI